MPHALLALALTASLHLVPPEAIALRRGPARLEAVPASLGGGDGVLGSTSHPVARGLMVGGILAVFAGGLVLTSQASGCGDGLVCGAQPHPAAPGFVAAGVVLVVCGAAAVLVGYSAAHPDN